MTLPNRTRCILGHGFLLLTWLRLVISSSARFGDRQPYSIVRNTTYVIAGSKMPTADCDAGCPGRSTSNKLSDEEIQDIVITANLTPKKCLGFKTPFQAILREFGKDVQIRFA